MILCLNININEKNGHAHIFKITKHQIKYITAICIIFALNIFKEGLFKQVVARLFWIPRPFLNLYMGEGIVFMCKLVPMPIVKLSIKCTFLKKVPSKY